MTIGDPDWPRRKRPFLTRLVVALVLLAPMLVSCAIHDARLFCLAREFGRLEHPVETSRIRLAKATGLQWGNGDHCSYIVADLRRSTRRRGAIEHFYATRSVRDPLGGEGQTENLRVLFFDAPPPDGPVRAVGDWLSLPPDLEGLISKAARPPFYIVYVAIGPESSLLDPRCL